jgi:radical SAM protein with 4Fe4S-binding SPASM domain
LKGHPEEEMPLPTDAIIAVTFKCNARCVMCDIWQKPAGQELKPQDYSRLPKSIKYINITGGEPFLRDDLPDIVRVMYESCLAPKMDISTNGLLPARIEQQVKEIFKIGAKVGVRVSVDGIGKRHDEVRGIEGAFDKAIASVHILKEIGLKDIGIAYTATNYNIDQLQPVADLAKKLKVQFTCNGIAQNSEIYFGQPNQPIENQEELRKQTAWLTREHLKSSHPTDWVRAYVDSGNYYFAATGKRGIPCFAGTDFFFMQPNGDVYPDGILDYKLGNIKSESFEAIWHSPEAREFRAKVDNGRNCPHQCWMLCTVYPHMRRNKLSCLTWIGVNKLRAHMRLPITPVQ